MHKHKRWTLKLNIERKQNCAQHFYHTGTAFYDRKMNSKNVFYTHATPVCRFSHVFLTPNEGPRLLECEASAFIFSTGILLWPFTIKPPNPLFNSIPPSAAALFQITFPFSPRQRERRLLGHVRIWTRVVKYLVQLKPT